jgi:hypothetical protein
VKPDHFSVSIAASWRFSGRLSSHARYSSWSATSAATAATQRRGRGGTRWCLAGACVGGAGAALFSRRSRARRRAWRSAGGIGAMPTRCLGILHLLLAIVTVTFRGSLGPSIRSGTKSQFLSSIKAPFLRPDLRSHGRRAQLRSRVALATAAEAAACPSGQARGQALDGGEHGAKLGRVGGQATRRSPSFLCSRRSSMLR